MHIDIFEGGDLGKSRIYCPSGNILFIDSAQIIHPKPYKPF